MGHPLPSQRGSSSKTITIVIKSMLSSFTEVVRMGRLDTVRVQGHVYRELVTLASVITDTKLQACCLRPGCP